MKVLRFLDNNLEEILITILCSALVVSLVFSVIVRYGIPALSMASHWAEEIAVFSFIWMLYFGASLATRKGAHFRVVAQFNLLPVKMRKLALLPGSIIWLWLNYLVIRYGIMLAESSMEESLSLQIPMRYIYIIIPLSFALISFRLIQHTIRMFKSKDAFTVVAGD
jgi:TRAP-type C4-dicarboxylate transport system permease small subunit